MLLYLKTKAVDETPVSENSKARGQGEWRRLSGVQIQEGVRRMINGESHRRDMTLRDRQEPYGGTRTVLCQSGFLAYVIKSRILKVLLLCQGGRIGGSRP